MSKPPSTRRIVAAMLETGLPPLQLAARSKAWVKAWETSTCN